MTSTTTQTFAKWMKIEEVRLMDNYRNNRLINKDLNRSAFACTYRLGRIIAISLKNGSTWEEQMAFYNKTKEELFQIVDVKTKFDEKKKQNENIDFLSEFRIMNEKLDKILTLVVEDGSTQN